MGLLETRPVVRASLDSSEALISRSEAIAAGLAPDDVKRLVRSGIWVPVRRGIFTHRDRWLDLDEWRGRPLLTVRAVHRSLVLPHAISHTSGALVHDLPVLRTHDGLVHVTTYGTSRARVRNGVKRHHALFTDDEVWLIDGLPVLGLARTALDIAREHGFAAGVCAIDAARQRGVSEAELWAAREAMWRWPGVSVADDALVASDPGAESLGESLSRILLKEAGLGPVQTQFELSDGKRSARCDMRVGRQMFEFDGVIKLRPPERGGVADRPPEEVVAAMKDRQDWVCGFHLGMSHITWPDFWGARRDQAKRRLRREYDATVSRYGTSIDDLAPYIVNRRG